MLLDQMMGWMEKMWKELQEAPPEKRDHFLKSSLIMFDISLDAIKRSPELRQKFAEIHSEFLRHPECKDTVQESFNAYEKYLKDK